MATLRVTLDRDTYQRLLETALSERRPVPLQAEVTIRRALGLPFPYAHPAQPAEQGISPSGREPIELATVLAEAVSR